jgi:hypothetical protein
MNCHISARNFSLKYIFEFGFSKPEWLFKNQLIPTQRLTSGVPTSYSEILFDF